MSVREKVSAVLKAVKPTKNLDGVTDIVEGGYLDSFEIMKLITSLGDEFGVEIAVDDMTPENFNSVDAIAALIETLKGR